MARRIDAGLASSIATVGLLLHLFFIHRYRFSSDELQHLHVAWGWTRGLVQYRDFFDNHVPLFHMLFAPIVKLSGERVQTLYLMRVVMQPLVWVTLLCIYRLASRLYDQRTGIWSVALLVLWRNVFCQSLEFRTDVLWMMLWVVTVTLFITARLGTRRTFFTAILAGLSFSVSLKTTIPLLSLIAGHSIGMAISRPESRSLDIKTLIRTGALSVTAFLLVPGVLIMCFMRVHALHAMLNDVFFHNLCRQLEPWYYPWPMLLFPFFFPLLLQGARVIARHAGSAEMAYARIVLFLTGALSMLAFFCFSPVVTPQDFLTSLPLLAVTVTSVLAQSFAASQAKVTPPRYANTLTLSLLALINATITLRSSMLRPNSNRAAEDLVADTLQLAGPDDPVMDVKGETVFRSRPTYYVLESVTRTRMASGLIADTIQSDMISNRCFIATRDDDRFPAKAREFLNEHFIAVGRLRVAGALFPAAPDSPASAGVPFDIAVPGPYIVVNPSGPVEASIDGKPCTGPILLSKGPHMFATSNRDERHAILWAPAVKSGFSPFDARGDLRTRPARID